MPAWETIGLRLLAIGGGLVVWFVTQRMIGARSLADGAMYEGALGRVDLRTHALIASSLGVDTVTLFVLALAVFGPSFQPFWGLLALFLLRQLCQAAVALPPPPGIIWRNPWFVSLFVTYDVGNDFFFSGHTALAVYGAMQLATLHIPLLTAAGIVVAALQIVAVIALRAHWTIDVVAGLAAAVAVGLLI